MALGLILDGLEQGLKLVGVACNLRLDGLAGLEPAVSSWKALAAASGIPAVW